MYETRTLDAMDRKKPKGITGKSYAQLCKEATLRGEKQVHPDDYAYYTNQARIGTHYAKQGTTCYNKSPSYMSDSI